MKVWISINNKPLEQSSYLIISPLDGKNPFQLDDYLDNNECKEIVVSDVFDCLPYTNHEKYLQHLTSKLAHKGQIIINGVDANEINKAYYNGAMSLDLYNTFLFGSKETSWHMKQSTQNLSTLCSMLQNLGVKIINKRLIDMNYSIVGERL